MKPKSSETSASWLKLNQPGLWRKFSLVLWRSPVEAVRFTEVIELDVSGIEGVLRERKDRGNTRQLTWTPVLLHAWCKALQQNPELNVFVRKNVFYTRRNVDALLRMNVQEPAGTASLWACYLRGTQEKSLLEIALHLERHQKKIENSDARYPRMSRVLEALPVLLLRGIWDFQNWSQNRLGWRPGFMPDLSYPSISMSNLGSLGGVLLAPLVVRGLHCPIHLSLGNAKKGRLPLILGLDHRVLDAGAAVRLLQKVQEILNSEQFLGEIRHIP